MSISFAESCVPTTFSPSLFGADILSIEAIPAVHTSVSTSLQNSTTQFCNLTVTYVHPGHDIDIIVEAWLPDLDGWNGRLQAVGGGGWSAGRMGDSYALMEKALDDGFATVTTDAGLGSTVFASEWALLSPGNVDLYKLVNLASRSLEDQAVLGKALVNDFYGKTPAYSYFNGCSQGGRQGMMLAQRYPTLYDGILAGSPAIYWTDLFPYIQWPQQFMEEMNRFPYGCEIDAITAAVIEECDELDGVQDRIIESLEECFEVFDLESLVGKVVPACAQTNGTNVLISEAAVRVTNATWNGMTTSHGEQLYHGISPGADLTGNAYGTPALVATNCTSEGCTGLPNVLSVEWLKYFVAKDPDFDLTSLTREEFDGLVWANKLEYDGIIATGEEDLTRFREAGGKMASFHGTVDHIIPHKATKEYFDSVAAITPDVQNFFRHFEVPGLGHCFPGLGPSGPPTGLFRQLQDWVEEGTAPDSTKVEVQVGEEVTQRTIEVYLGRTG